MRSAKGHIIFSLIFLSAILTRCATGDKYVPSCCLISTPDVTLTGEKTSIERQIVGEYKELEKDAWIVSSVNTGVQRGEGVSVVEASDEELLRAMKIREFHDKKIRDYKEEGAIGEKNDGSIVYREAGKYEQDSDSKKILLTVIEEENKARKTIFARSLIKSGIPQPKEEEMQAFGKIFAEEQRALAKKNDWIQDKSGIWVKKK